MKEKCQAIRDLKAPTNRRQTKKFLGMVNYLSMYLPRLQILLKPLYALTKGPRKKKGVKFKEPKFEWNPVHQEAFEKIKKLLESPEILTMPRSKGKLVLFSDTCKTGCGGSLYQEIDGSLRLIAYHSKALPASAARYGISELEMTGLVINIMAFRYLLRGNHFQSYVDHSSLCHIMRSKIEPPTDRFKRLMEKISDFSFDLGYRKGEELVIADYLSRSAPQNDENPEEVIPISFSATEIECSNQELVEEGQESSTESIACPAGETVANRPVTRAYAKKQNIQIKLLWKDGKQADKQASTNDTAGNEVTQPIANNDRTDNNETGENEMGDMREEIREPIFVPNLGVQPEIQERPQTPTIRKEQMVGKQSLVNPQLDLSTPRPLLIRTDSSRKF